MSKTTIKKGFDCHCIKCGAAAVALDLDDLDSIRCRECDEEFYLDDVRQFLDGWRAVIEWIDAAPARAA